MDKTFKDIHHTKIEKKENCKSFVFWYFKKGGVSDHFEKPSNPVPALSNCEIT